mgnify:CR=1 FL=1
MIVTTVGLGWLPASLRPHAPARMASCVSHSAGRTASGRKTAAITGPLMHLKRTVFPDKPADCFRSGESGRDASWLHAVDRMPFRLELSPGLSQNRRCPAPNSPAKTASLFHSGLPQCSEAIAGLRRKHKTHKGRPTPSAGLVQPKGAVEGSCLTFAATFIASILASRWRSGCQHRIQRSRTIRTPKRKLRFPASP